MGRRELMAIAMFGIHDFGLFLAAGFLLNLTPGPDTLYILGRSVAQGREAGVASAFRISVGSIFHTCAANPKVALFVPVVQQTEQGFPKGKTPFLMECADVIIIKQMTDFKRLE
jgi:hypothetical protein